MPPEVVLEVPQGRFELRRFPRRDREQLRAWDAADDYLLHHLHDEPTEEGAETWILNDGFGALTVAMAARQQVSMSSDSWLAHAGTQANLDDNDPGPTVRPPRLLTSLEDPPARAGVVLVKIPRSLALLEDQLHRIRHNLQPGGRIVGAGMVRAIHTSTLRLFEDILGSTSTTLARRKARLVMCQFDRDLNPGASPYPTTYQLDEQEWSLTNHAGVFCREHLDAGTRHLLAHVPEAIEARDIVDLGCGNGVVGLVAAHRNPDARLTFVDESYMAVDSARCNWQELFGGRDAAFLAGDCLESVDHRSADLILCNPPFHQQSVMGDAVAWRMFSGARKVLRSGGAMLVVGNRHLAYHSKLRRIFGNCDVVDSDPRFVVLRSYVRQ
ncbi:MAG: methyltransferase [Candidatus Latescibacteria bacterium]|nr:methyltransferase [Candidatus Latescibacterota bacterium]MDP7447191.1 methyltransferase [Candidatus Latescibacterota bacterium]HJP30515.1 methyltransferase [Candidatus Latescibacterota bacterium]